MCQNITDFILCTCSEEDLNKPSENNAIEYQWQLIRYEKTKDSRKIGKIVVPVQDIGNGLTDYYIAEKLNSKNCFDFDYLPKEKDALKIYVKGSPYVNYIEFTYKNGAWKFGKHYDSFNDIMKELNKGKLKPQ